MEDDTIQPYQSTTYNEPQKSEPQTEVNECRREEREYETRKWRQDEKDRKNLFRAQRFYKRWNNRRS